MRVVTSSPLAAKLISLTKNFGDYLYFIAYLFSIAGLMSSLGADGENPLGFNHGG